MNNILESGIINLDKPIGPTSHKVCEYVKKILPVGKVGHSGTLDPKATGVLPIGINQATRILELTLLMPKEYVGVMRLHSDVAINKLRATIKKKFLGKIRQIPPRKSAVVRKERERDIYEFKILEKNGREVLFRVKCEAGTYVRKLIDDLGKSLGIGAHMLELRRTAVGNFSEKNSVTLYELTMAYEEFKKGNDKKLRKIILPLESAVEALPKISVDEEGAEKLKKGMFIYASEISKAGKFEAELVAVFSNKKLICLGKTFFSNKELEKVRKKEPGKFVLRPVKVFV